MGVAASWGLREVPSHLRQRYLADGSWADETFARFIDQRVVAAPSLRVRIWSEHRPCTTTLEDLHRSAARLASGLAARGLGAGDVIAYQMPNWLETLAVLWAGFRAGATMVPIIHFYGPRELAFIVRQSGARALVVPADFAGIDYIENLAAVRGDLDSLETVVIADSSGRARAVPGGVALDDLMSGYPMADPVRVDPDAPAMIGYTSGTTADPKGVVHSHRTLLAEVRQLGSLSVLSDRAAVMAAPLAHMTGMLGGSLVPLHLLKPLELIDHWDPRRMLAIMRDHGVSPGGGATIFLTSLLEHPHFGPEHLALMPQFGLGGAPVPRAVAERAEGLGIRITRAYGSTEHPSITGSRPDDPVAKRTLTDGCALAGVDLRLVDADGTDVRARLPGQILSRGPDLFLGYTDPALTAAAFDDDGWYHTADVGVLDRDGYLTITDRMGDIIIRGGLNLSASEIEERLATMPAIAEVAVVAAPDERLGEHACAVIRLMPGAGSVDLADVRDHLAATGLPKQKWPEELRIVGDFDRTPSGKIRKRAHRDRIRDDATGGA
jgi:acyl-CoA synthetase (AMP-forming)/AMP-acid ligase II